MRRETAEELAFTKAASLYVIALLLPSLGGGTYMSIEDVHARGLAAHLDRDSGIDGFQCRPDGTLWRSIASRMQSETDANGERQEWMRGRCPDTFTIRTSRASGYATEYEKRKAALEDEFGATRPDLVIQGYVRDRVGGPCFGAAAVKGDDLYRFVIERFEQLQERTVNTRGRATFKVVRWRDLIAWGATVRPWYPPVDMLDLACSVVGIDPDEFRQPSDDWAIRTLDGKGYRLAPNDAGAWVLHGPAGRNASLREIVTLNKWLTCRSDAAVAWAGGQRDRAEWIALSERRAEVQARLDEAKPDRRAEFAAEMTCKKAIPEAAE